MEVMMMILNDNFTMHLVFISSGYLKAWKWLYLYKQEAFISNFVV